MKVAAHHEILDARDPMGRPLAGSLALHGALVGLMAAYGLLHANSGNRMGDPNTLGGGTPITPVNTLPIPHRYADRVQPVANDTDAQVPQRREDTVVERPDRDATAIGKKEEKKKEQKKKFDLAQYQASRRQDELAENQLASKTGPAVQSPLFGVPGSGGVGVAAGNPFGNRFGFYAQLIRDCVARRWTTTDIDSSIRTAPPVVVNFSILRNGSVKNLRLGQRSGVPRLDYSCLRAIEECSPFQPLPAGFEQDTANVEFIFKLQR